MSEKWMTLPCPHCGFAHSFKRTCDWSADNVYLALYSVDDDSARRSCKQGLLFGTATYGDMETFNLVDGLAQPEAR